MTFGVENASQVKNGNIWSKMISLIQIGVINDILWSKMTFMIKIDILWSKMTFWSNMTFNGGNDIWGKKWPVMIKNGINDKNWHFAIKNGFCGQKWLLWSRMSQNFSSWSKSNMSKNLHLKVLRRVAVNILRN